MSVVITKHFIAQTCCSETRINGISLHRHLDLENFKSSLEEKGYYSDNSILCFNGLVIKKDFNTITVDGRPTVIAPSEKIDDIFEQLVEAVAQAYNEKNAFRKKVEEAMKTVEQVQKRVEALTQELENYKNLVSSLQKEIETLKEAKADKSNKGSTTNEGSSSSKEKTEQLNENKANKETASKTSDEGSSSNQAKTIKTTAGIQKTISQQKVENKQN